MDIIIDPKTVPIPLEVRNKWQNIVNILTRIMNVPAALIMKVDFPAFTVYQSSDSPGNPYALKDPEWDKNPRIGMRCDKARDFMMRRCEV